MVVYRLWLSGVEGVDNQLLMGVGSNMYLKGFKLLRSREVRVKG